MVTTLPAKAGSFWLVPKASALTGASRATHTAPRYVGARRLDPSPRSGPCRPEGAAPLLVFLLSRGEVLNAILTAEHLKEPKPPSTRDMSYPRAFPVELPEHTVRVKVPGSQYHAQLTGNFPVTSLDAAGTCAGRRACLRHPHSPPACRPESPAEIFYGPGRCGSPRG